MLVSLRFLYLISVQWNSLNLLSCSTAYQRHTLCQVQRRTQLSWRKSFVVICEHSYYQNQLWRNQTLRTIRTSALLYRAHFAPCSAASTLCACGLKHSLVVILKYGSSLKRTNISLIKITSNRLLRNCWWWLLFIGEA